MFYFFFFLQIQLFIDEVVVHTRFGGILSKYRGRLCRLKQSRACVEARGRKYFYFAPPALLKAEATAGADRPSPPPLAATATELPNFFSNVPRYFG